MATSRQIPVYAAEREAGLEAKVRANASVAYAMEAQLAGPAPANLSKRTLARLMGRVKATNEGQPDLHYLTTVLVTTGWNKNDDVFDRVETWFARHSPEDKPFNYEHNQDDIIGHITGNYAAGADHKPLPDDAVVDDLPDKFHVVTAAVLYKLWDDDGLQERMDGIIAEMPEGKWFVSMEAHFGGFDYAMVGKASASGGTQAKVVARCEKTAFLTKHLRAYGGSGVYQGYKLGRLLRGIVFAGKGLVRKPANPESVIFTDTETFDARAGEIVRSAAELGYGTVTAGTATRDREESTMAADNELTAKVEEQKAKIKALREENDRLIASQKESDTQKVKAAEEAVKARDERVAALTSELAASNEKLKVSEAEAKALREKAAESDRAAKAAADELARAATERKLAERVAAIKAAYQCDDAKASELAATLANLDDASFKAHADYIGDKLKDHQTTAGGDGKQTPAKEPPLVTGKPAPMAGHPTKVKTLGSEVDANDRHADPKLLDDSQPNRDAALTATATDEGVEKTRASIKKFMSGYFGLDRDDAEGDAK